MQKTRKIALVLCAMALGAVLTILATARTAEAAIRSTSEVGLLLGLNGSPSFMGCISATTSAKNNADATAFSITKSTRYLLVVPSSAARVLADTDATEDITTTNGVPLAAGQHFVMILKDNQTHVQSITDSGTSTVCFWSLE